MSDTQPSQRAVTPPEPKGTEKPTVEMAPPPSWAIALSEEVKTGFRALRADIGLVANDVTILRDRVVVIERWKLDTEERVAKNSERVKAPSAHDLETQRALADEKAAREALAVDVASTKAEVAETKAMLVENNEATLAIKKAVVGVTTSPKVKTVAKALFYLIVTAAAAKGWVLK